jgi:hypothetical protein
LKHIFLKIIYFEIEHNEYSIINLRLMFDEAHLIPAIALIAFPLAGCNMTFAVALICIAMAGNGAISSGHIQSYMDIAPNFAGTFYTQTNT